MPRYGVVHPVAGANIDPQLPDAIPAKAVVAEITLLDTSDPPDDGDLGLAIPEATEPVGVEILRPIHRQVVVDPVRTHYSFLNEKVKIEPLHGQRRVRVKQSGKPLCTVRQSYTS